MVPAAGGLPLVGKACLLTPDLELWERVSPSLPPPPAGTGGSHLIPSPISIAWLSLSCFYRAVTASWCLSSQHCWEPSMRTGRQARLRPCLAV